MALRVSMEEVLSFLCDRAEASGTVGSGFRDLAWQRERAAPTTFGNQVALPHPLRACGDETLAWVGLLDRPVAWNERGALVRAVFLVSFSQSGGKELDQLFSRLADLFVDEAGMARLIAEQAWSCLEDLLS